LGDKICPRFEFKIVNQIELGNREKRIENKIEKNKGLHGLTDHHFSPPKLPTRAGPINTAATLHLLTTEPHQPTSHRACTAIVFGVDARTPPVSRASRAAYDSVACPDVRGPLSSLAATARCRLPCATPTTAHGAYPAASYGTVSRQYPTSPWVYNPTYRDPFDRAPPSKPLVPPCRREFFSAVRTKLAATSKSSGHRRWDPRNQSRTVQGPSGRVTRRPQVRSVAEQGAIAHRTLFLRRGPLLVVASVAVALITGNKPILVFVMHCALCSCDELENGGAGACGWCPPVVSAAVALGALS
jgi:hypothetical protein